MRFGRGGNKKTLEPLQDLKTPLLKGHLCSAAKHSCTFTAISALGLIDCDQTKVTFWIGLLLCCLYYHYHLRLQNNFLREVRSDSRVEKGRDLNEDARQSVLCLCAHCHAYRGTSLIRNTHPSRITIGL